MADAPDPAVPTTAELVALGAPITLRDGSHVRIRQGHHADRELLVSGFERLSDESRYRRFLAPVPVLSTTMVDYLTDVDHHDHEAMVALDGRGEGIGVARFVRSPSEPTSAEIAVTVIDEWQGRGLGTVLLEVIGARARREGITTFTALMLATNHQMIDVLEGVGPVEVTERDAGCIAVRAPIPHVGLSPVIRRLLQRAASARPRPDQSTSKQP